MFNIKKISEDLFWVGANDRRIALFESTYPVPNGVSYNSYILLDEKTVLFDTVDKAVSQQFFENIEQVLNGRNLDYMIINHMEPDHCSQISCIVEKYPNIKIVCNAKTQGMINQFFNFNLPENQYIIVKEGDNLNCGKHNLSFVFAPMVHWPEVMVTYDNTDKILFSADAFGTFGAIDGNIFSDEVEFNMDEARRYYTNIVGKYGAQVQMLLKKAAALQINTICPLHGWIWRKNINQFIEKYQKWSTYTPEINSVLIVYSSVYGNTQNAAEILAGLLAQNGVSRIKMFDTSTTHYSYIIAEAFRYSHIIFASTTYNNGVFVSMDNLLRSIVAHNLQNRTFAIIENGSWMLTCAKGMKEYLQQLKNCTLLEKSISIKSACKKEQLNDFETLAKEIAISVK